MCEITSAFPVYYTKQDHPILEWQLLISDSGVYQKIHRFLTGGIVFLCIKDVVILCARVVIIVKPKY
jgi:hypothetical protein